MSTSLLLVSALSWVAQTLAEGEGEVAAVGEAPAEGGAGTAKVEYAQYIMDYFQDLGIQPEHVAYVIVRNCNWAVESLSAHVQNISAADSARACFQRNNSYS
jgi:hypothetical protein